MLQENIVKLNWDCEVKLGLGCPLKDVAMELSKVYAVSDGFK